MKKIPNCFICGAPKSGTTALAKYLSEHDEVFFSKIKEPFFWAKDIKNIRHQLRPKNLDEYLNLFKEASEKHKILAEGSTNYLRSKVAVNEIYSFNPNAKFIVMLRKPLEQVQAFHMEQTYVFNEAESFGKAWENQEKRESNRSEHAEGTLYREVASYSNQIERLLSIVPEKNVKIILYDDFCKSNKAVHKDVLNFLNLSNDNRSEFPRVNSSHAQRWPIFAKFILRPPLFLKPFIHSIRRYFLENPNYIVTKIKSFLNVKKQRVDIDRALEIEINSYFKKDIQKLSALLKRDLSHWYE